MAEAAEDAAEAAEALAEEGAAAVAALGEAEEEEEEEEEKEEEEEEVSGRATHVQASVLTFLWQVAASGAVAAGLVAEDAARAAWEGARK